MRLHHPPPSTPSCSTSLSYFSVLSALGVGNRQRHRREPQPAPRSITLRGLCGAFSILLAQRCGLQGRQRGTPSARSADHAARASGCTLTLISPVTSALRAAARCNRPCLIGSSS